MMRLLLRPTVLKALQIRRLTIQPRDRVQPLNMTSKAFSKASSAIESASVLPELVVFDLDYTLWPYWCEMKSQVDDPYLYPDALSIIEAIRSNNIKVAIASRTPTPRTAEVFLKRLGKMDIIERPSVIDVDLVRRFDSIQLIAALSGYDHVTAQKDTCHLPNIQMETGIEYSKMLFFDDEYSNIRKVSNLGVASYLVDTSRGMDVPTFIEGLKLYEQEYSKH